MIVIRDVKLLEHRGNWDILVEGNRIKRIGKNLMEKEGIDKGDVEIIDGRDMLAIPGLVNTHSHIPMTLFRGVADDIPLMEWLNNYIWKMESKLNEELVYIGTLLGAIEMIKSGTTTFNDMYFYLEGIVKGVVESGIRAVLSYGMIDLFQEERREREIKNTEKIVKRILEMNNPRVKPAIGPHAPYTCSRELLTAAHEIARRYNVPVHIHMNETLDEIRIVREKTGMRPFEYLDSIGFFKGVKVIAAHCVHLSDREMEIMEKRDVVVSHNPISNLKLGSGIAPIPELLRRDIPITLGTDGPASNNNLNLFEEVKMASLIHKGVSLDPTLVPGEISFKFATLNGGKALNLEVGVLKEGYLADIVLIDLRKPYLIPVENLKSHIVYAFKGVVDTVLIDGNVVLKDGKMVNLEEYKVYEMAERAYNKLIK